MIYVGYRSSSKALGALICLLLIIIEANIKLFNFCCSVRATFRPNFLSPACLVAELCAFVQPDRQVEDSGSIGFAAKVSALET